MKDFDLKISAVSYLNSKPFLFGFFLQNLDKKVDLQLDIPAECARKLMQGDVNLGLIPVAAIPQLKNPYIVSDFCIGCDGAVKTVCIYSEFPIEDIEEIYLDYQSRTSVALLQILLKEYWKTSPRLLHSSAGYIHKIKGKKAGLVIGDRTMGLDHKYPHIYDLGKAWKAHTGLPFVFAAWVSNGPIDHQFLTLFNQALSEGVERIPQVAQLFQSSHLEFDVLEYYQRYISYELTAAKQKALSLFLDKIQSYELVRQP